MSTELSDRAPAEVLGGVMRQRRTNLNVDLERAVPQEMIAELLELATWAPNHRLTNPWRFSVLTGEARARLGELEAAGLERMDAPQAKIDSARVKYLRAPVVLMVGSAADDDPVLHRENRDSVAAGVQNILLAATAMGLASKWSTGTAVDDAEVKALAGLEPRDELVAFVYLGWPSGHLPTSTRGAPASRWMDT